MAKRVLRNAWGHIRSDCGALRNLALRGLDALAEGQVDTARAYVEEIGSLTTRHFRMVDAFLEPGARCALRSDHNRMRQLVMSIALAMRDAEFAAAADYLERLVTFVGTHEATEGPHVP